ncbi:MAG: 2-C-methyl-D-erythritol 4-phosphate cytidylyltransferase [Candidatus Omnitrophica bacterium]|nr:2-C-methyl-D-erythritol 4-phosphate cytidylyltransferase [Candidatus Omnitrophota bacterium]
MKVLAIIPAAGSGKRLKKNCDKPFIEVNSKPLLFYALNALESSPLIDEIILVVAKKRISKALNLVRRFRFRKVIKIIRGGKTRSESVSNGLKLLKKSNADLVFIHDGVRPFLEKSLIERCIKAAKKFGSSVACVPVKPTIKAERNGFILKTLERSTLLEAQTPQVFRKDLILKAYKNKKMLVCSTDDSKLVEKIGHKVRIVEGSNRNIKVTTPEDLLLAKALLKR